jgi:hypothetical protein
MKTPFAILLLSGVSAVCGSGLLAEPTVVVTEVVDATPPALAIPGRAVLAAAGDYTCHDGALGVRIQLEREQRRLEIVFDRNKPASHAVELAAPPAATEWFLVAERADLVWYVKDPRTCLRFEWRADPATGRRTLRETSYALPHDAEALNKAGPPREVAAQLAKFRNQQ